MSGRYSFGHELQQTKARAVGMQGESGAVPKVYSITISLDSATLRELIGGGFTLYGCKAVYGSNIDGAPLLWFESRSFSVQTQVAWTASYEAYTSTSLVRSGGRIYPSFSQAIEPGQTLEITGSYGGGYVSAQGQPDAIAIFNQTAQQFCCGVAEPHSLDTSPRPTSVFVIYGRMQVTIRPLEQVLLMFAPATVAPGTVLERTPAPGLLVDMAGENSRSVAYSAGGGWSWDGDSWARAIPVGANTVPLLIRN
ncbi:MAG TPA: hypothetical protein VFS21_28080 [Roseiflexaceae bacterium]|nr:hypothetical protein [Roseiflexaceae bacterium]